MRKFFLLTILSLFAFPFVSLATGNHVSISVSPTPTTALNAPASNIIFNNDIVNPCVLNTDVCNIIYLFDKNGNTMSALYGNAGRFPKHDNDSPETIGTWLADHNNSGFTFTNGTYSVVNVDYWTLSSSPSDMDAKCNASDSTLTSCQNQIQSSERATNSYVISSSVPGGGTSTQTLIIPTSTATQVLASVTGTLADPGFLTVAVLVIGIPLAFYVAKKIIKLFPKT